MVRVQAVAVVAATLVSSVLGQTFRRAAACPTLGCVYPPDQTDFIAGSTFDIRIEVQAPANGSAPYNNGEVNPSFKLTIAKHGEEEREIASYLKIADPAVESYNFTYYETLFEEDAKTPTLVNVLAKSYRAVSLYYPGKYTAKLYYGTSMQTVAHWEVKQTAKSRKAKNVILFIGDGMTSSMATAARLLGHRSINGKYQTKLALDTAEGFGLQMTHSIDSFITDSANSATALYAGKKSTVNALNAYTDSTGKPFGDPKFETVFEMARRIYNAQVGIVSTAYLAATPAAVVAHTSQRSQSDAIIEQFLNGVTANYSWPAWNGPDVLFGGGGSDFLPKASNGNKSQVEAFKARGYDFATDNTTLHQLGNDKRALGLFAASTMSTWLDRNVYTDNLATFPTYNGTRGNYDQPGLKDMTIKAIDILHARSKAKGVPFVMMSEAASIDKQMHIGDVERALGELLELDDTVRATLQHLKDLGELDDTLVVVTADHGHGFDVYGSVDTQYLQEQTTNATKRNAVGTYQNSGLSQYQVAPGSLPDNTTSVVGEQGPGFPVQWEPRYVAAYGLAADVDRFDDFQVHDKPRNWTIADGRAYIANEGDSPTGFYVSGNLPVSSNQGVHSLTDVPIYAWGAGADLFRGIMNSPDVAFKIAEALDLGRTYNATSKGK